MSVALEQRAPVMVGCDVGQIHDPTAIAVVEISQVNTGKVRYGSVQTLGGYDPRGFWIPPTGIDPVLRSEYTVRFIRRLPLGTSYPDVAMYLADMLSNELFARRDARILLDATGIGRAIYDDLKREISLRKECQHIAIKPISFVHGERYNRRTGALGKAYLVSRLQSLLQGGCVHAPDTAEMKATLEELKVFEVRVSDKGVDQYGAFKTGAHDDLAVSLALAVLENPFSEKVSLSGRVY